jgi:hypothetical protein
MSIVDDERLANDPLSPVIPDRPWRMGPVSRARQRRTRWAFVALQAVGLLPVVFRRSKRARALGLGLSLPGGGFVFSLRWPSTVATLLAFALSAVAWLAAGMTSGPVAVWLGAAVVAARGASKRPASRTAEIAVPLVATSAAVGLSLRRMLLARKGTAEAARRNEYLAEIPVAPSTARHGSPTN